MLQKTKFLSNQYSTMDQLFCKLTTTNKFFSKGIGDYAYMNEIPDYIAKIQSPYPIDLKITAKGKWMGLKYWDFSFVSPMEKLLPEESKMAFGRYLAPQGYTSQDPFAADCPTVMHFAGTADQGYGRRSLMLGNPLARLGIASLMLENAYYGKRKPTTQKSYYLESLTDLFKLGHATGEEGRSLIDWLHQQQVKRLAITGISMGGLISAIVGALSEKELALVPFVPPHGPEAPYMDMALYHHVDWKNLNTDIKKLGFEKPEIYLRDFLSYLDIRRFSPPKKAELVHLISAQHDAYIPKSSTEIFESHWPGIQISWLNTGHVGSVLFHSQRYVQILDQMLKRL